MVYSSELGYDPDEWEECPNEEHLMMFGFFTRMFLSLIAISSCALLFWVIEARKQWVKARKDDKQTGEQPLYIETIVKKENEEIHVISERKENASLQQRAKQPQESTSFSREEEEALEEWRREVARLEESRMKELEEHMGGGSEGLSEIETESQLIDNLLPAAEIAMDTDTSDMEQFQAIKNVCSTPPCTPPNTTVFGGKTPPFEEISRKLTRGSAKYADEQVERVVAETITGRVPSGNGLTDWEAPPREEFKKESSGDLEQQFTFVSGQPSSQDHNDQQIRESSDSENGFIKVSHTYTDQQSNRHTNQDISADTVETTVIKPPVETVQTSQTTVIKTTDSLQTRLIEPSIMKPSETPAGIVQQTTVIRPETGDSIGQTVPVFMDQSAPVPLYMGQAQEGSTPRTQTAQEHIYDVPVVDRAERQVQGVHDVQVQDIRDEYHTDIRPGIPQSGDYQNVQFRAEYHTDVSPSIQHGQDYHDLQKLPAESVPAYKDTVAPVSHLPPELPTAVTQMHAGFEAEHERAQASAVYEQHHELPQLPRELESETPIMRRPRSDEENARRMQRPPSDFEPVEDLPYEPYAESVQDQAPSPELYNSTRLAGEQIIGPIGTGIGYVTRTWDDKEPVQIIQRVDTKEAKEMDILYHEYEIPGKQLAQKIEQNLPPAGTYPPMAFLPHSVLHSASKYTSSLQTQQVSDTLIDPAKQTEESHLAESQQGWGKQTEESQPPRPEQGLAQTWGSSADSGILHREIPQLQFSGPTEHPGEIKRLAEADIYVQDAMEYVSSQRPSDAISGFVIEEDMLESVTRSGGGYHIAQPSGVHHAPVSGEATSQLVKTNEAFEKMEQIAELDDTMTYAPEIQSIEIPPDQASDNSDNLQEYFDHVAAECTNVFKMPFLPPRLQGGPPSPLAQRRLEASPSISSLRSGRSYTSSEGLLRKRSSLLDAIGVTSMQEMLLALTSLQDLSAAMAKAGLESTNLIFGIDYTASNKYQGELCFGGKSLHSIDPRVPNPYQQVISVMGRALAPFATSGFIPTYGFGDAKTGDWSVFKLKQSGECRDLDEVLSVYNELTPTINLSGPTNFAPLIYQAIEICQEIQDYHILVVVADGQVTNEKATRKAIVRACQYPLSIIVVGVGDGPWDMMRVFDESLPKRPWDNFHFVEFHEVMRGAQAQINGELTFAIQSLLEIPDQYNTVRQLGLIRGSKLHSRAK